MGIVENMLFWPTECPRISRSGARFCKVVCVPSQLLLMAESEGGGRERARDSERERERESELCYSKNKYASPWE